MYQDNRVIAIILAAGNGNRFSAVKLKQDILIHDIPILQYSINVFDAHNSVDEIILILPPQYSHKNYQFTSTKQISFVEGGESRSQSVLHGLETISKNSLVFIHDGARPCIDSSDIDNLLKNINEAGAILALPCVDTLKQVSQYGVLEHTVPRELIFRALTPQCFFSDLLQKAIIKCHRENIPISDDASAMEFLGYKPKIVLGKPLNIKLTYPEDLPLLEFALDHKKTTHATSIRIGQGYDIHIFGGTKPLVLGGIIIPCEKHIQAHSDGDVVIHAIIDALLGALALGDIGKFYPDNDKTYSGIHSTILLTDTFHKITTAGYIIGNIDLTILLEKPKISEYTTKIQDNLATYLKCSRGQISIKATTTEHKGSIGREEAVACMVNLLLIPKD